MLKVLFLFSFIVGHSVNRQRPFEWQNFAFLISMLYRLMPPYVQRYWVKRCYISKQKQQFGDKVQNCKDGSGLQVMNFFFVTGGQEIKIDNRVKFEFFSCYFVSLLMFLCSHHFWRFVSSHFKAIK